MTVTKRDQNTSVLIGSRHSFEIRDRIATLIIDSPPVNALSQDVRAAVVEAIRRTADDVTIAALIIRCAGRTFIAGADIREFGRQPEPPSLPTVIDVIEASQKPVIAAIHGNALGGGLELAMACHARIGAQDAKFGLPEVKLGLIPGAGGTQRLPRLIGVRESLDLMVTGTPITASNALALGLIDKIADHDLPLAAQDFAHAVLEQKEKFTPIRLREDKLVEARRDPALFDRFVMERHRIMRGFDAPEAVVAAVRRSLDMPFDDAILDDRAAFQRLRDGPQSAALRYLFFAERNAVKVNGLDKVTAAHVSKVGIVGAGTMGRGIAIAFLVAGYEVMLIDSDGTMLAQGLEHVRTAILKDVSTGRLDSRQAQEAIDKLTSTRDLNDLAGHQLVIEAVYESLDVKCDLLAKLDRIVGDDALLATNTSYLSVSTVAAATRRPERVLGMHFFSPANIMKLLEIVRTSQTSDTTLATAINISKRLRKIAVIAGDAYGFIGNRMLAVRQREADQLILEGASPWRIDKLLVDFGMPMGPFQTSDLAGLDLGWTIEKSTGSTVRELLCECNRRGQKTRAGYYDYDEHRNSSPSAMTEELITGLAAKKGIRQREFGDDELIERLIYPIINEGARILEDGIAARPSDIDVVWVNGYGWPRYLGGPMHYADNVGLVRIVSKLRGYAEAFDERFAPANLLVQYAESGKAFTTI